MDKGADWNGQFGKYFAVGAAGRTAGASLALHLSGGMRRRVQDLGLVPGTRVTCVRRALSGDPIAYRIRGAVVALRKCDAAQIEVQP